MHDSSSSSDRSLTSLYARSGWNLPFVLSRFVAESIVRTGKRCRWAGFRVGCTLATVTVMMTTTTTAMNVPPSPNGSPNYQARSLPVPLPWQRRRRKCSPRAPPAWLVCRCNIRIQRTCIRFRVCRDGASVEAIGQIDYSCVLGENFAPISFTSTIAGIHPAVRSN